VVRVGGAHHDVLVSGDHPPGAGDLPGLLSDVGEVPAWGAPVVQLVSDAWQEIGLGAIQDWVQEAHGAVDLDRSPVELATAEQVSPACPACSGKRFGFPADLDESRGAMCPTHRAQALAVIAERLSSAGRSNPDGWEAMAFACRALEEPHLPNGLWSRMVQASGVATPSADEWAEQARMVLEAASWPDRLSAVKDADEAVMLDDWLICLPLNLGAAGLVDEGVAVGSALADLDGANRATYLADLGVVLGEGGREEEARARIAANLAEYPREIWVRIHAGDALSALGDSAGAEARFREAATMARADADPEGEADALERLSELLSKDEARSQEAADAAAACRQARAGPHGARLRSGPKVGRNSPCPCGSGRKYKRCCGAS
ncbi:MAG: SEC-C metal-binding domain-containing protein, partial [Acidimicrobiales bacterium]